MAEIELTSFEVSLQNLMIALEASDYDEAKHQIKELHPGEIALFLKLFSQKIARSCGQALKFLFKEKF